MESTGKTKLLDSLQKTSYFAGMNTFIKAVDGLASNKTVVNLITALTAIVVGGSMAEAFLNPDEFWSTVTGGTF